MKLVISPHCDDETLFCSFTILRERPKVVIVFDSYLQNSGLGYKLPTVTAAERRRETERAMEILGAPVQFLGVRDDDARSGGFVLEALRQVGNGDAITDVWSPAIEMGGNQHHNLVGAVAEKLWPDKVKRYLTYTLYQKSRSNTMAPILGHDWPLLKLQALTQYKSQIEHPSCRDHFLRDQFEYYAE